MHTDFYLNILKVNVKWMPEETLTDIHVGVVKVHTAEESICIERALSLSVTSWKSWKCKITAYLYKLSMFILVYIVIWNLYKKEKNTV